ncbi:MAG: hypothetical protein M1812_001668 [Candelaria pacifica]|nr:MAG: hypothetical protein M1812_001668 [Candelaria pacifica]
MDPKGPAQPSLDQVYETSGNPASQTPKESHTASINAHTNTSKTSHRTQNDVPNSKATSSALDAGGFGEKDAPLSSGVYGGGDQDQSGRQGELEGEQMGAPGEGDIMRAQENKTGAGEQASLTKGLDRKKEEQRGAREAIQDERRKEVDIGGALGDRGGPANVEGR